MQINCSFARLISVFVMLLTLTLFPHKASHAQTMSVNVSATYDQVNGDNVKITHYVTWPTSNPNYFFTCAPFRGKIVIHFSGGSTVTRYAYTVSLYPQIYGTIIGSNYVVDNQIVGVNFSGTNLGASSNYSLIGDAKYWLNNVYPTATHAVISYECDWGIYDNSFFNNVTYGSGFTNSTTVYP